MKKRIVAGLLTLVMVFSLLPATVLAAEITSGYFVFNPETGTITGYIGSAATVRIPDSIEGIAVTAVAGAFSGKTQLKTVVLPSTVKSIGANTFYGCTSLTSVNIPNGVTAIGEQAFYGCSQLANVNIPLTVKTIGHHSFFNNSELTSITIPGTVDTIEESAFDGCGKLAAITLQDGVRVIGKRAFAETGAAQITIPGSVEEISAGAFQLSSALTSVYIPDGVKTIGNDAFAGANRLTLAVLPKSLQSVGTNAFLSSSLKEIHYVGSKDDIKPGVVDGLGSGVEVHYQPSISNKIDPATCTKEGSATRTIQCGECSRTFQPIKEILPILPHNARDIENKPATCTENGSEGGKQCTDCGTITEAPKVILATGHTWVVSKAEVTTEPTCQETGVKHIEKTCSACGEAEETDEILPVIPHTYDGGKTEEKIIKEATCTETGTKIEVKVCDKCGEVESIDSDSPNYYLYTPVEIPVIPHTYDGEKTERLEKKKATCSEAGYYIMVRICDVCGEQDKDTDSPDYYKFEIPTIPHVPDKDFKGKETIDKQATCTEKGQKTVILHCSVCGQDYTETQEMPELGHDWKTEKTIIPATCTEDGEEFVECLRCDATKDHKTIPASGHILPEDAKVEIQEATCTENGLKVSSGKCIVCGEDARKTEILYAEGHKPDEVKPEDRKVTKEPTCTEEGEEIISGTCAVCHEKLVDSKFVISPLGHKFGEWTKTSDGGQERVCSVCGFVQKENASGELINPDDGTSGNPGGSEGEPSDKPSDPDTVYSINLSSSISNGSITRSTRSAKAGETVTLTAYANAGYELSSIYVQDSDGDRVTLSTSGDNRYTFTMPALSVRVYADFTNAYRSPGYVPGSSSSGGNNNSNGSGIPVNRTVPRATASGTVFYDIPSNHWASGEIVWAYQNGFMSGTGTGGFNPDGTFTYQQMWMVLARLTGSHPTNMAEAKQWATRNGFAEGANPTVPVTRQQLVTALYRCAALLGRSTSSHGSLAGYKDSATVPNAARNAMSWAITNGIISGTSDGRLNPGGTTTRAQFAVILYRYYRQIM